MGGSRGVLITINNVNNFERGKQGELTRLLVFEDSLQY